MRERNPPTGGAGPSHSGKIPLVEEDDEFSYAIIALFKGLIYGKSAFQERVRRILKIEAILL